MINLFDLDDLHALPHETLENHYRVPVKYINPNYIVFVGNKFRRTFTEDTLPDNILSKLTMARASDKKYLDDDKVNAIDIFYYPHDDSMGDVGWRVSETMYIVVLEERELRSLLGIEDLMDKSDWNGILFDLKEENDTRRKSKSKSKKNLR